MKVEVAVLGFPSLTVRTVSVDVKQHAADQVFRLSGTGSNAFSEVITDFRATSSTF